jgi:archaellum component FlaF (FlaF/FlaG flagellin family)
MSLTDAQPVDSNPAHGLKITVSNNGQLVLPATLRANLADGTHLDTAIPAETWMQHSTHTFTIPTTTPVTSVTLDPHHQLPLPNRPQTTLTLHP